MILLTGGLGFIGSHTAVELLRAGKNVVIVDDLSNSTKSIFDTIRGFGPGVARFYEEDIRNTAAMESIMSECEVNLVIHFAAKKSVPESASIPNEYYSVNVSGTISLIAAMDRAGVRDFIYSSSASVYGNPKYVPIDENHLLDPLSVYARTKQMGEQIVLDAKAAKTLETICILRYFNPVGAHDSGLIGESPSQPPTNLFPVVIDVIEGQRKTLSIFGSDYDTKDGTGIRDYIHVQDLAKGHLSACCWTRENPGEGEIFNLGTGYGYSVLDVLEAFEEICGTKISFEKVTRRPGDPEKCFANCQKAEENLFWRAEKNLTDMCSSAIGFRKSVGSGA